MPFRVAYQYESMSVINRDPAEQEVRMYLTWLRREVAVAAEMLTQLVSARTQAKKETAKK